MMMMMTTMLMQEVDARGGSRGWMQGVYRWIPPGWLRASYTVGGKLERQMILLGWLRASYTVGGKLERQMILLQNVWKCLNYFWDDRIGAVHAHPVQNSFSRFGRAILCWVRAHHAE